MSRGCGKADSAQAGRTAEHQRSGLDLGEGRNGAVRRGVLGLEQLPLGVRAADQQRNGKQGGEHRRRKPRVFWPVSREPVFVSLPIMYFVRARLARGAERVFTRSHLRLRPDEPQSGPPL